MNIIGFNASPRKDGNTAWAVGKILEGAKERGADIRFWNFGDLDIAPCAGCLGCVQSGKCAIDDGMQGVYEALEEAEALVLGAPVYMGQMSAQAKIFTDRLFAQITPRFSPRFKEENAGKRLILVFTQGNPDEGMFRQYFDYTEGVFKMLEFDVREVLVVAGMRTEAAREREGLCDRLKGVGASLVG
jgi:multimeric flavodoxin WrbA